jgi:hypothetical protein
MMLATQTTYPSWGYMITNPTEPATTLWELWNAPSQGPSMNSRNHIMFGSIGGWFHRTLAGIVPNGHEPWIIRPRMSIESTLTYVSDTYHSIHGDISVTWSYGSSSLSYVPWSRSLSSSPYIKDHLHGASLDEHINSGTFTLDITIPPNLNAIVHLPTRHEFGRQWKLITEPGFALYHDGHALCRYDSDEKKDLHDDDTIDQTYDQGGDDHDNGNGVLPKCESVTHEEQVKMATNGGGHGILKIDIDTHDYHPIIHIASGSFSFLMV